MCTKITDDAVFSLVQALPKLTSLKLSLCELVSDEAVLVLVQCCRELRTLGLARSANTDICRRTTIPTFLTDAALKAVGRLRSLTELDMSANAYVQGTGLRNCSLPKLRVANFRGCTLLSNEGLRCLMNAAPQLIDVDLTGCEHLDEPDLAALSRAGPYTSDRQDRDAGGLGIEPAPNASALMMRDAFHARRDLEKASIDLIMKHFHAHQRRWACLEAQSTRTLTRALRAYQFRCVDPDYVRFRKCVIILTLRDEPATCGVLPVIFFLE
jgi:hypothetical protein